MTNHLKLILTLAACISWSKMSYAQNMAARNVIFEKIDSVIANAIKEQAFPGAVLYATHEKEVLLFRSYGYHTYDSSRRVDNGDIYDLASVTKVSAGTLALMKLYEEGLIKLDDPINKYVPEISGKRGKATLREILAHQSGWRSWIPYHNRIRDKEGRLKKKFVSDRPTEKYDFQLADNKYLRKDFYRFIKRMIAKAEYDSSKPYTYSGLFFYLIPEIVENLSGLTFEDYLNANFYRPMGLSTLKFNPLRFYKDSLIAPTEVDTFFREQPIHGYVHDEGAIMMRGISANAGLFGNAQDVGDLWSLFLNEGKFQDTFLLEPSTIQLFTTVQYPNNDNRRGLGFDKPLLIYDKEKSSVAKSASGRSYGHSGYTGPLVWADPESDLLFVFLCNRVYPSRNQRKIYELNVRPTLHEYLYQAISPTDRP